MLKCKIALVVNVNYEDLESFILEETGQEYDIPPNEECGNDTYLKFNVSDVANTYSLNQWEAFKAGKGSSFMLSYILHGLCVENKIQPGEYLIQVSW